MTWKPTTRKLLKSTQNPDRGCPKCTHQIFSQIRPDRKHNLDQVIEKQCFCNCVNKPLRAELGSRSTFFPFRFGTKKEEGRFRRGRGGGRSLPSTFTDGRKMAARVKALLGGQAKDGAFLQAPSGGQKTKHGKKSY